MHYSNIIKCFTHCSDFSIFQNVQQNSNFTFLEPRFKDLFKLSNNQHNEK